MQQNAFSLGTRPIIREATCMRMRIVRRAVWLVSVFALGSCARVSPSTKVSTEVGCGLGGYASMAPVLRRATLPALSFRSASSGILVVAYDADGGAPISNMRVRLMSERDTVTQQTTVRGAAFFQPLAAGPALLDARLFNFLPWRDSIRLRSGFVDTMELHMGRMGKECLIMPERDSVEADRA